MKTPMERVIQQFNLRSKVFSFKVKPEPIRFQFKVLPKDIRKPSKVGWSAIRYKK